ncbi:MAG TPA: alpha/beta fold hydrolase [Acidobacteriaceae bacterium]|nr:alpha/beta fold hydrolase [Acidobacteriaceae bacterium]
MFLERDGFQLFYTTLGSGPDVVLLHPTPTHHAFWLPVAWLLADRYRLTLIDLRGHGQSMAIPAPVAAPITMEQLAGDVHAIVQTLTIGPAAYVGCSIGSYLLYEYWRRFPEQVAALVLTCGKPQPDTEANRERRREWMAAAQRPGGLEKFFGSMAETLVGGTSQRQQPAVRAAARNMMSAMPLDAMLAIQQGLALRPDSVPTLQTIDVPVCAIAGSEDQSSTPHEMQVIADQVAGAEFHLLQDAGHYAPLEQPERVAGLIGKFLDRQYAFAEKTRTCREAR